MNGLSGINEKIEELISTIDDEDTIEEINSEYEPFKEKMNSFLNCDDLESFIEIYEEMNKKDCEVTTCFSEALNDLMDEEEKTLDNLKLKTAQASCDALELIIFDVEADY